MKYPWIGEKTEKIQIRVTPKEKQLVREAATAEGLTLGQYLLRLHRAATAPKEAK